MRDARRALRASTARAASIETSNELFNEVLCRSVADLYMLMTDTPYGTIPYAGIPWFSTPFGRDAIITALEMLWIDPSIAKGVLRFLAATQATEIATGRGSRTRKDLARDALGRDGAPRRGSVRLLLRLRRQHAAVRPARRASTSSAPATWLPFPSCGRTSRRRFNGSTATATGTATDFVEYQQAGETGLANQGWKDSADSVFHADGSDAEGPIALCEVQGYVYAAKRLAARIAAAAGRAERADRA